MHMTYAPALFGFPCFWHRISNAYCDRRGDSFDHGPGHPLYGHKECRYSNKE